MKVSNPLQAPAALSPEKRPWYPLKVVESVIKLYRNKEMAYLLRHSYEHTFQLTNVT